MAQLPIASLPRIFAQQRPAGREIVSGRDEGAGGLGPQASPQVQFGELLALLRVLPECGAMRVLADDVENLRFDLFRQRASGKQPADAQMLRRPFTFIDQPFHQEDKESLVWADIAMSLPPPRSGPRAGSRDDPIRLGRDPE
jgi:hypothetical protein